MQYAIELKKEHGFVRLTFSGTVTRSELELSLDETYSALITNGWYKVFIDVTHAEISVTQIELYVLTTMLRSKYHLDTSIAFLARPDQMRTMRFIEMVANNHCIDLRAYPDQETALDWLVKCSRYDYQPTRSDE
jgi:hypothetical protein